MLWGEEHQKQLIESYILKRSLLKPLVRNIIAVVGYDTAVDSKSMTCIIIDIYIIMVLHLKDQLAQKTVFSLCKIHS